MPSFLRPSLVGILLLATGSCQPPRHIRGVVYDGSRPARTTTGRALITPVMGATVSWTCPPGAGGPPPQSLLTDNHGAFASKELSQSLPADCELIVKSPGFRELREPFKNLCDTRGAATCRSIDVVLELVPEVPTAGSDAAPAVLDPLVVASAVRLDAARAVDGGEPERVEVVVNADGTTLVDGAKVANDEELKAVLARKAPERVVIKADASVTYSRAMQVMDVVKASGATKISLGSTAHTPDR